MDSAWGLFGLAGALGGTAVVLVGVAFTEEPLALPLAVLVGLAAYGCHQLGLRLLAREVYADVGGDPVEEEPPEASQNEDWHRRAVDDPSADGGTDVDDEWPRADDPFFDAGTEHRGREHTGEADASGDRAQDDAATNRWNGWSGRDRTGVGDSTSVEGGHEGADGSTVGVEPAVARAAARLGVTPDADTEAIRAAYRERVKEVHPDHGGDAEQFTALREAYEVLLDRQE